MASFEQKDKWEAQSTEWVTVKSDKEFSRKILESFAEWTLAELDMET